MNRQKYERFYGYGAYTLDERPQNHELHQQRYANFQQFLDTNPGIRPVTDYNICCQHFILSSGRYKCDTRACRTDNIHQDIAPEDTQTGVRIGMHGEIFDHSHSMRIKGVRKSYIAVTHPYNFDPENIDDYPKGLLQGLVAKVYPSEKDWYYPGSSILILISTPETFSHLDQATLGKPTAEITGTRTPSQNPKRPSQPTTRRHPVKTSEKQPETFDEIKYENLQNALQSYDTFLAFCETDDEWDTIMRLHDRIRDERDKMTLEKKGGKPEEIESISARELGKGPV